jgi:diaminopimelate dehydrogenase
MGKPRRLQLAVIGPGRLGLACARALLDDEDLALAGIVRRPDSSGELTADLRRHPVVSHVRDLQQVAGVARELLQARIPVVECAALEGRELELHHAGFVEMCQRYRATAVVVAGWNPGLLTLIQQAFRTLIPRGDEVQHRHPGLALHHSAAAEQVAGVAEALEGEMQGADGLPQRYVYLRLQRGADFERVRATILSDPLHAGEPTQVFELDDLEALESGNGQGLALERRATAASGSHASLVFEARCEPADFAARVMLDAARRLPALHHGAHRYALGL